ncbi:MAG: Gfo/Idh/MocA family protein [Planctomycetaceae bacterium]
MSSHPAKTQAGISRRSLLGGAAATAAIWPVTFATAHPRPSRWSVEQPGIGGIGLRYQGSVITEKARSHGNIAALCDVDRHVREQARAAFGSTPKIYENYLDLLNNPAVDVVCIGTPDHWHSKMLIDACRAGKDVYCEKPLTLTLREGHVIRKAVADTQRVVQVGSWQRSDHRFRLAVELVRSGRIGQLQSVDVVLGKNVQGGPFERVPVPKHFNWNLWQGQTPDVPFLAERSHYTFRWWSEYSGGQMTDWGAHHVDIANWGINSLPVEISGKGTYPDVTDGYNVPIDFSAEVKFANGVVMTISDTGRNGIMFNGSEGRIFVNRGTISGKPVEDLASQPLERDAFQVYDFDNLDRPQRMGKLDSIINHMGNFFDCVEARRLPVSDVESQHRSVSLCHLSNIAVRLGRRLNWDPEQEDFRNDAEASSMLSRPQRAGFEVL